MGRGFRLKNNTWYIRRYKGDGALYALCRCGYKTTCYYLNEHFGVEFKYPPPYCPMCGERKRFFYMHNSLYNKYFGA